MTTALPTAQDLANEFAVEIRKWVSPDDCREIDRRNKAETSAAICHSHDFCDANQAMINALSKLGMEFDLQDEPQMKLIDDAWRIVRGQGFGVPAC